ncbi:MAG TPA: hypothetical protein VNO26_07950 [Candidatus Limnocylindria bacterium]|nr:hypothetical protein [Candidatus Limnocylindria bacterium]
MLGVLYRIATVGAAPISRQTAMGMVGYVDPQTGRVAAPPDDVVADVSAQAAQASRRLVVRRGTTAGGGILVEGVPMMQMTATVGADGRVSGHCGTRP